MKIRLPISLLVAALLLTPVLSGCSAKAKKARILARAESDFHGGDYDKAKIGYMQAIRVDPRDPKPFQRIGQMWLEDGDPLFAGTFLKHAQELDPKDTANSVRLAQAYQAIGQFAEARKVALAVLQSGANGEALVLLAEIARAPEEISQVEQILEKYQEKNTAAYEIARADLAARRHDLSAAEVTVTRAIQLEPKSAAAHQAAGILAVVQQNRTRAAEELKIAASLAASRSPVQMTYASWLLQAQGSDAARAFLDSLTKKAPDFLPAWSMLSRLAYSEKRYDDALKLLDNIISRDARHIEALLMQADCFLAKSQPQKAVDVMQRLLSTFPASSAAELRLAQAYLQQHKPAQASAALDQALKKNPEYPEAILLQAQLKINGGKLPEAIDALEHLLKKQPNMRSAQLLLADAYRRARRFQDAAAIFREQIKLRPTAPDSYLFLGKVEKEAKNSEDARKSFEKVLELAPENLPALSELIDLDLEAKDFAAATGRVQERLKKHSDSATLYVLEGKILIAQQQWPAAESALKKGIELDANLASAYGLLVSSYLATNRLPEAASEMEAAVAKMPNNRSAWMLLASIREKLNDHAAAQQAYEKLLATDPDFVPALNNLAYLDVEYLNQLDRGLELAQKARQLAPTDLSVSDTVAWALYKRGDYQQALPLLQESADKWPSNSEIRFHLGMTHYMMGDTAGARSAFEQVVASPGDSQTKATAAKRLALLGTGSGAAMKPSIKELEKMVAEEPQDLVAILWLADAYDQGSEPAKAAATYEAALKLNPKLPKPAIRLAQLYSGPLANREKALTYAKQARDLSPQDAKTTALLGRAAFDAGDTAWAYSVLQESSRQLPSDAQAAHDLAWAAYAQGKLEEARRVMERCLGLAPDASTAEDAKSFLSFTALFSDTAALAQARPKLDEKLHADPDYIPAVMSAAALDAREGNRQQAIKRYQQSLQRFPNFALAQLQLASLYLDDPNQLSKAYDLASQARKVLPEDAMTAQVLGEVCYERKEYARAGQLLQESSRQSPLDATGHYYLGMTYKEQKQALAAIQELTAALTAGLPAEPSKKAQQALIELRMSGSDS